MPMAWLFVHEMAAGMGNFIAGDSVARAQMSKAMKINEAKEYVAGKLGISVYDLSDSHLMKELREQLDIGHVQARDQASRNRSQVQYCQGVGAKD